jgi:hypothetical protein
MMYIRVKKQHVLTEKCMNSVRPVIFLFVSCIWRWHPSTMLVYDLICSLIFSISCFVICACDSGVCNVESI